MKPLEKLLAKVLQKDLPRYLYWLSLEIFYQIAVFQSQPW